MPEHLWEKKKNVVFLPNSQAFPDLSRAKPGDFQRHETGRFCPLVQGADPTNPSERLQEEGDNRVLKKMAPLKTALVLCAASAAYSLAPSQTRRWVLTSAPVAVAATAATVVEPAFAAVDDDAYEK